MTGLALVGAHEDMFLKLRHGSIIDFLQKGVVNVEEAGRPF
jgi:hypothetical protein